MVTLGSCFTYKRTENRVLLVSILQLRSIYASLRCFHSGSKWGSSVSDKNQKLVPNGNPSRVGLFWDLDNKPQNSIPPYEVANKLRIAASSFGVVRYMVAYANSHTFSHVPRGIRERRKERELMNLLENKGIIKPNEPYLCRVCGRKFYTNEKLVVKVFLVITARNRTESKRMAERVREYRKIEE